MNHLVQRYWLAEGCNHAVGHRPEQWRVDARGLLFDSARQAQFGADDALPVVQSSLDDDALSRVRGVNVQLRVQMCERSNSSAFLLCKDQLLGDLCSVDHAALLVACENRTVTAPRCANSARNTSDGCTGTIL
jgi:hypothetical protein